MTFQDRLDIKLLDITESYRVVMGNKKNPDDWSLYKYLTEKLGFKVQITNDGLAADIGPKAQLLFKDTGDTILITNTYTNNSVEAPSNKIGYVIDAITEMLGGKAI